MKLLNKESRLEHDRQYSAKVRAERKANGLCTRCGGNLDDPQKSTCFHCREYLKERRAKFLLLGICPVCGKERICGEEKMCISCADKHREKDRIKRENNEQLKESKRIYGRALVKSRKEQGLCPRCGKRKMTKGFQTCALCRYRVTEKSRERRARNEQRV